MATQEFVVRLDDIDAALLGTVKAPGESDEQALERLVSAYLQSLAESTLDDGFVRGGLQ